MPGRIAVARAPRTHAADEIVQERENRLIGVDKLLQNVLKS
jgi:hypothetical protein